MENFQIWKWRIKRIYLPVIIYSGLSIGLLMMRMLYTSSVMYGFLVWNLFLAFVPFWAGIEMIKAINQKKRKWKIGLLFFVWLSFLPNAPYILTDLFHLVPVREAPLWYDLILILSFAWTGLLLWLISINHVHNFISKMYKSYLVYALLSALIILSGIGVYMGRYGRWNSWDLIVNPHSMIMDMLYRLAHPFSYPAVYGVTIVFSMFLGISYLTMRLFRENIEKI